MTALLRDVAAREARIDDYFRQVEAIAARLWMQMDADGLFREPNTRYEDQA